MPRPGHHLHAAAVRRGNLRQQGDRRDQGAGSLHGGLPDHDRARHLHHQRHRARRRVSQLVRSPGVYFSRTRQDLRQGGLHREDHPEPRGLARVRRRQEGHRRRAHRPQAPPARHRAAEGARVDHRRDPHAVRQRPLDPDHPREGPRRDAGRGARGHLPQAPPGRAAHGREREDAAREPVLQPQALRRRQGRPAQGRQEARQGPGHPAQAAARPPQGARRARQPRQEGLGAVPLRVFADQLKDEQGAGARSTRPSSPTRTC